MSIGECRALAAAMLTGLWLGPLYALLHYPTPPGWAVLAVWALGITAAFVVMYSVGVIGER
jgi:hypothetical protein